MLPAAPCKVAGSRDRPRGGPAPPGDAKDILIIYEEDATEWALYLREIFLCVVKREAILLYCLENFSPWHLKLLILSSYKCKLLILSNGLLKDLTPKKCQFLEEVLYSPESVVTLLCGMKSSDQLYQLLNVSGSRWGISAEQEPEDYISVIKKVIFGGSEDYLEVDIPKDPRVKHAGNICERKETEDLAGASRSTAPLAMVLPAEIPCENPGEIFILLRDEVIGETVEVEFVSNNKHIRKWPTLWNKKVWSMKALAWTLYLLVTLQCFAGLSTRKIFIIEKKFFIHESVSGYYRVSSYFLGKLLSDLLPRSLFPSILFSSVVYVIQGLKPEAQAFFITIFTLLLVFYSTSALALAMRTHEITHTAEFQAIYILFMLVFFSMSVTFTTIPPMLLWLQHLSILYYGYMALQHNEFLGQNFCPELSTTESYGCSDYVICTGEEFLTNQGTDLSAWGMWKNHLVLASILIIFLTITYLRLLLLKKAFRFPQQFYYDHLHSNKSTP